MAGTHAVVLTQKKNILTVKYFLFHFSCFSIVSCFDFAHQAILSHETLWMGHLMLGIAVQLTGFKCKNELEIEYV